MGELFSQQMRGASFDETGDSGRQRRGVGLEEHMDMIRLNREPDKLPSVLFCYLFNDGLEPIMNRTDQHLAPSLRAKDEMGEKMMHTVLFVNIRLFHVS
jgi:hypothetical protein